ncbi:MAG: AMP-binding protein [Firmicutes bacterium]|nr:AMP-binding protein [Bacillota bacterium]
MKNYPYNKIYHLHDLKEMMNYTAEHFKNDIAFQYMRGSKKMAVTFDEFRGDTFAFAAYLNTLSKNSRKIALIGENSYEWIVCYIAAVISGKIIVPIDKELKSAEAAHLVRECSADMVIYSAKNKDILEEFNEAELSDTLCLDDFALALTTGSEASAEFAVSDEPCNVEATCAIIFTSGTTGEPKGVMLCQRNLMTDMIRSLETLRIPKGTVAVLPFNHTFGFMACVLCQIYVGFPVFINSSLRYVLRDIKEAKPGHISVVPLFVESFYKGIWKNARKSGKEKALKALIAASNAMRKVGIDMRRKLFKSVLDGFGGNLEMIITGGAPISGELIKGFEDFGITVINGFGITECSPIVAINRDKWIKPGSVGQHINTIQVKTINEDENGNGEICVKGDIVMQGYYNKPEATAEAFIDGWFKTGDIGRIDKDGFVFINGRKKNLIILENGKNVSPEELEYLIGKIDGVDEVLVYSEDSLITAEVYAEDMSKKDAITDAIKNKLNPTIASYKQIRKVKFRATEFEKTSTKKIKR